MYFHYLGNRMSYYKIWTTNEAWPVNLAELQESHVLAADARAGLHSVFEPDADLYI